MPAYRIVINKGDNTLSLYDGDNLVKVYPVGTGRSEELTPKGTFRLVFKTWFPSWTNPATGEAIPSGSPRNPLGSRWMGLDVGDTKGRVYGIHGTNAPETIGTYVSLGCVRMQNRDVEELYELVPTGTEVTIL